MSRGCLAADDFRRRFCLSSGCRPGFSKRLVLFPKSALSLRGNQHFRSSKIACLSAPGRDRFMRSLSSCLMSEEWSVKSEISVTVSGWERGERR